MELMKRRWKIVVGLVAVVVVTAVLLLRQSDRPRRAVQETRLALRAQGVKTDLADFDFTTSGEFLVREAAITNVIHDIAAPANAEVARRRNVVYSQPNLMSAVGSNSALVVWKQVRLEADVSSEDLWPPLRNWMEEERTVLDAVCNAIRSGPIRFNLNSSAGVGMLLTQLAPLKRSTQELGQRAVLDMHDHHQAEAWTNLLAVTRLTTAYDPRPTEISHLVRIACSTIAYNVTWQLLQADGWADDQLARIQREWESVDYFRDLPETAAFNRAAMVDMCQRERLQPLSLGLKLSEIIQSPRRAWSQFSSYRRQVAYRDDGSYEDEKALLLHYRDRELELRQAIQSPTWLELRGLPGVTNPARFQSRYPSRMQSLLNLKQINIGFQGQGRGLAGSAAEAEARRRLLIAAIAVERYRGQHGSYPTTLQDLVPDLLAAPPIDFMDGQPLRYRRTEDEHYVLHSVGLDCVDNGGNMLQAEERKGPFGPIPQMGVQQGLDLVWPRPASTNEVSVFFDERKQAIQRYIAEETQTEVQHRSNLLTRLEELCKTPQPRHAKEPTYQGQPLSRVLQGLKASEIPSLTLDQLLTIKQVITGREPNVATFEVPVGYDVVTNIGELALLVDVPPKHDPDFPSFEGQLLDTCHSATNGNCLLAWNTTYDTPGKHFVQARLSYRDKKTQEWIEVRGPLVPFCSSNICQFDPWFSQFDSSGATLYAKLPESNGVYAIEIESPDGARIKTFKGTTSNGVIQVRWNLIDDQGQRYTNDSFQSIFHVTLSESGRSPTQQRTLSKRN